MDEDVYNHPYIKLFYRPFEIAIRWCDLVKFETQIFDQIRNSKTPQWAQLKQWPCLGQKLDLLWDAIRNGELVFGSMGITVKIDDTVDPAYLTIRHTDLKAWFNQYHPFDKPAFLFNTLEQRAISPLTHEVYRALLIEVEALKLKLDREHSLAEEVKAELENVRSERVNLLMRLQHLSVPTERNNKSYLRLIAALIQLMLGKSPNGNKYSAFESQASIISVLLANNNGKSGFTKRTLEEKFAAANRSIETDE